MVPERMILYITKTIPELLGMLDKWRKETNATVPTKLNPEYFTR